MIAIDTADRGPEDEIAALIRAFDQPTRALKAIGELVVEFTKTRFELSQDPYGRPWAPNADATLRALLHRNAKNFTPVRGHLSQAGRALLAAKKPLIGESGELSTKIAWRLVNNGVEVRSTKVYAAMQQFGGTKARFPNLWGDIPARPFFPDSRRGLPDALAQRIRDTLAEALSTRQS